MKSRLLLPLVGLLIVSGLVIWPMRYTTFISLMLWGYAVLLIGLYNAKMRKNQILTRVILLLVALTVIVPLIFEGLFKSAEDDPEVTQIDYLLVLGAGLWGDTPSPILEERLITARRILDENENVIALLSGGQGDGENIPESMAMKAYLTKNGIEDSRMILESESTSTSENIAYSLGILEGLTDLDDIRLAVVTSDFHLYRAKLLLASYGIEAQGIAADTPRMVKVEYHLREYLAIVNAWFEVMTGGIDNYD